MTIHPWIRRVVALRMTIVPSAISRVSSRASASRVIDFRTRIGRGGPELVRLANKFPRLGEPSSRASMGFPLRDCTAYKLDYRRNVIRSHRGDKEARARAR